MEQTSPQRQYPFARGPSAAVSFEWRRRSPVSLPVPSVKMLGRSLRRPTTAVLEIRLARSVKSNNLGRMCVTVPKNEREKIAFSVERPEEKTQRRPVQPVHPVHQRRGGTPRGAEHTLVRQPGAGGGRARRRKDGTPTWVGGQHRGTPWHLGRPVSGVSACPATRALRVWQAREGRRDGPDRLRTTTIDRSVDGRNEWGPTLLNWSASFPRPQPRTRHFLVTNSTGT